MPSAEQPEIVPIRDLEEVLETLLRFDADSQRINFPRDAPNPDATAERLRKEYAEEPEGMHVVRDRGKVVGCVFLRRGHNPFRNEDYLDLRNIYLLPEYRGRGIGVRILKFMETYAKEKGCRYLYLGTAYDNVAARALFEGFGFQPTRVVMEKDVG